MTLLDRRGFLLASAGIAATAVPGRGDAPPRRIVRVSAPQNLESDFHTLSTFITPTESFYVRSHFAVPKVDPNGWKLGVAGEIDRPREFTLADLQKLGKESRPLTLECAGNGRVFLSPPARGVNWQYGAVGNAEWTGVPLAAVLDHVGIKPGASEIILEGADSGTVAEPPSPGVISFARSIPVEKARKSEVMLAWAMNGKELQPAHGAPVRAVVGGWYGMASVKWLTRIHVTARPFRGFWQTLDYTYFHRVGGLANLAAITAMQVKSQMARPAAGEVIPAGKPYRVIGMAWAGEADVEHVDVSVDGGKTWARATLLEPARSMCWRLWEYAWTPGRPGPATLMARATDSLGRTQPMERNADLRTYMISHVLPIDVTVR